MKHFINHSIFVYLLQHKIILEKDNFHRLIFNDLQSMARCGKACDKKAYSDLNYVGHKTIHIDLTFTRSRRQSKHVKILGTEI